MKLYSLNGTTRVSGEAGEFSVGEDGSFEFPEEFGSFLHRSHQGGGAAWETSGERSTRLADEAEAHRRDPATLLEAVEALQQQAAKQPKAKAKV